MTVRPATAADAAAIAAVHIAAWRETYADLLPAAFLDGFDVVDRAARWRRIIGGPNDLGTFVAEIDGAVVGFASACPQRKAGLRADGFDAELATVYLLRRAQRRGLGRRLVAACAGTLQARGVVAMSLWVFRDNGPARAFYAALGAEACGTQEIDIAGTRIAEVAYGWRDLAKLME
jgi:ribosomal protein S18 acetylase RimI-like enzyme